MVLQGDICNIKPMIFFQQKETTGQLQFPTSFGLQLKCKDLKMSSITSIGPVLQRFKTGKTKTSNTLEELCEVY